MQILLVDDQILFQEGLTTLINCQQDFSVVGNAESVSEAIKKARLLKPDLILMDFSLPDGTGLDATQVILAERPVTKIVFLTVHEEDERLFEAIRYGAQGYLLKNIPSAQLLAYLRGIKEGKPPILPEFTARILNEFSHTRSRSQPSPEAVSLLTERQCDVLRELKAGASNRQIASRLTISEQTVKNHLYNIFRALDIDTRREAIDFARRHNI